MSGHSKWSTIKRQKGVTDARRGNLFTKLGNSIAIAVRQNQGVENAIARAKAANMPKDNIARAIDRGTGKGDGVELQTAIFEGFGPGNVAVVVEAITDNTTRTAAQLRSVFEKHGGRLASPGAVSYLFTRVGEIEDETLEKALEVGALDFQDKTLYTKPEDLHRISEVLGKPGRLIFRPNKETLVSGDVNSLLDSLDALDDVQEVYTNAI